MLKVISNSTPIIHLAKINHLHLLKEFFHEIDIPKSVYLECIVEDPRYPEVNLIKKSEWMKVSQIQN